MIIKGETKAKRARAVQIYSRERKLSKRLAGIESYGEGRVGEHQANGRTKRIKDMRTKKEK